MSIAEWNAKARPWLKIQVPTKLEGVTKNKAILKTISAVYSNLRHVCQNDQTSRQEAEELQRLWQDWQVEIAAQGHKVRPTRLGNLAKPAGRVIYCCSPRINETTVYLLRAGLRAGQQNILNPISVVELPVKSPFPPEHENAALPACWRGILGEMEVLIEQTEMQRGVTCGLESINKTALVPLYKCRQEVIKEMKRRRQALQDVLRRKDKVSRYQLATNYWRVEECFWGLFHDDQRPPGHSIFDILRMRLQDWRSVLRKDEHINIRDFIPKRETVAAVNQYIGGMIVKRKAGMPAGTIIRQLRSTVIMKEKNTQRVLKGRVICS